MNRLVGCRGGVLAMLVCSRGRRVGRLRSVLGADDFADIASERRTDDHERESERQQPSRHDASVYRIPGSQAVQQVLAGTLKKLFTGGFKVARVAAVER